MDIQTILPIVFGSSLTTIVFGWLKEIYFDRREQKKKRFQIQEEAYRVIMECADFIYDSAQLDKDLSLQKKQRFIENYRLLFLHAPDEVVRGINQFLDVMTSSTSKDIQSMKDKKDTIAASILTLRKQFVKRTKLSADDFKHIV